MSIYSPQILQLAANLVETGRLKNPDGSVRRTSRVCGSVVEVDLRLEAGVVVAYGHRVDACALGQAASAVMAAHVVGSTPGELCELRDTMEAMLREGGEPPGGKWRDLALLQPVRDYPARHGSTMLIFNAVVQCLENIAGREK